MANCDKSLAALIKPDGLGEAAYSKFRVEGQWLNPETGISKRWVFNINSDVTVIAFHTPGADQRPPQRKLTGTWQENTQLTGFDNFNGIIGQGLIYIKTEKGVVIRGPIVGGPDDGQSFVGAGTWTSS